MQNQSKSRLDQNLQGDQQRPKRFRRSRKDCDQRTFVCQSCNKSYLSNAALYTHVKNKHPDEFQKTEKQMNTVVKNVGDQDQDDYNVDDEINKNEQSQQNGGSNEENNEIDIQNILPNLQDMRQNKYHNLGVYNYCEALEGLRQFMKKYYPQRNKNCTIRLICQGLAPEILEYIQPILREASQLKLSQVKKSSLSINQIVGIFLLLMNTRVSSTCINFLIRYFFYFHYALVQESKKNDYCQKQNAYNVPNLFNSIILNQRIPTPGFDEDQIMHNPIIVCKVLHYFGNWLYEECYTDYQLIQNYKEDS